MSVALKNFRFVCLLLWGQQIHVARKKGFEIQIPGSPIETLRIRIEQQVPLCAVLFANSDGHHYQAVSTTPLSRLPPPFPQLLR